MVLLPRIDKIQSVYTHGFPHQTLFAIYMFKPYFKLYLFVIISFILYFKYLYVFFYHSNRMEFAHLFWNVKLIIRLHNMTTAIFVGQMNDYLQFFMHFLL